MLQHYANQMTPAASLAPFGIPITEIVPFSRYQPWFTGSEPLAPEDGSGNPILEFIAKNMGDNPEATDAQGNTTGRSALSTFMREGIGQPSATITNPAQGRAASAHYEAFSKGPIVGYDHMLRGYEGGYPIQDKTLTGGREMTNSEYFGPKFTKFIKEKSKELAAPTNQFLLPHELNKDMMPQEEQVELLKEWTRSLNPAERKELERIESPARSPLGNENYRPIVESFSDIRDTLKDVGITAGGAGAGGLAGNYLHRLFGGEKGTGRNIATATGAGLGGAASFLGGTAKGRGYMIQLGDLLKKLITKKASVSMPGIVSIKQAGRSKYAEEGNNQ
jgi:hypothetical protein